MNADDTPLAMRDALVELKSKLIHINRTYTTPNSLTGNLLEAIALVNSALATTKRNCDRFSDYEEATAAWRMECPQIIPGIYKLNLKQWLFAPVENQHGENK